MAAGTIRFPRLLLPGSNRLRPRPEQLTVPRRSKNGSEVKLKDAEGGKKPSRVPGPEPLVPDAAPRPRMLTLAAATGEQRRRLVTKISLFVL